MDEEQGRITEAICRLRERVRWRPGKDTQHRAKRIELGQLPVGTTLAVYDALFIGAISPSTAEEVVYRWGEPVYPTVVADVEGVRWLVMGGLESVLGTACLPEDLEAYVANLRFQRLGTLAKPGR
jgi:hypothetical protein